MNTPVSFEIAKLLKEKKFDETTNDIYSDEELLTDRLLNYKNSEDITALLSAPTIAEVVMWLYEGHGIWIVVETALGEDIKCLFSWYCTDNEQNILCSDFDYTADAKYHHKTPTEAYDAAIEYTLNKLI